MFDYQDNIIDVLKSEDTIEDLEKYLTELKKENEETATKMQENVLNKKLIDIDIMYLFLCGLEGGIINILMNSNFDFSVIIEKINKIIAIVKKGKKEY